MPIPRFLRRGIRRLLPHHEFDLVFSKLYARSHSAVPNDPLRAERILTFLSAEGLCTGRSVHTPFMASMQTLLRVHTEAYLESLREENALQNIVGVSLGTQDLDDFLDLQRLMVGGTNLAARLVQRSSTVAIHLGGGLHHAWADRGQGFCILNDVAAAIASQRAHGFKGPVLVVDLDLHHGDGTEAIFAEDPTVHTFSIHNRNWSDIEAVASTRIELGDEVEDSVYLAAIREALPNALRACRPKLAFYLAGSDPAADDGIGDWRISPEGMLERDRLVMELLRPSKGRKIPTVVALAGGYGSEAWRYSARFLAWLLSGGKVQEPPSTDEVTLLRYRMLAKVLDPRGLTDLGKDDDFSLTEEDIYGGLAGTFRVTRFLNYYTKPGLELVLERSGILDRLRSLGYREFSLDWDLDDTSGQTLRLFGDHQHKQLLAELRARRNLRLISGYELLHIEWLLLQNPRASFPEGTQPLPGQEFPGLGLLRDLVALLILICDRLQLDGLSFVPSHYHLAATSRKLLRFLEPADEAFFQALSQTLQGLPLAQASQAVEEERVIDDATGETAHWYPMTMVFGVNLSYSRSFLFPIHS